MGSKPCCISSISEIDTQFNQQQASKISFKEQHIHIKIPKTKEKPIPIEIIQSKLPDDDYCFDVIMNLYETIKDPQQKLESINDQIKQDHYDTYTTKSHKNRKQHQSIDRLFRQRSSSHHEIKTRSLTTRITEGSRINLNTLITVNIKGILKRHQYEDNYLTSKIKSVHFKDNHHHHKYQHKHLKAHSSKRIDSYK